MEPGTLRGALGGLVLGGVVGLLVGFRRGGHGLGALRGELLQELRGQSASLRMVAAAQASSEARVSEALRAQDRHLSESLANATTSTSGALMGLERRLAEVGTASRALSELSAQVADLRGVLRSPVGRGEFGERQLEAIVRDLLPPASFTLQAPVGPRRVDCLVHMPWPPGPIPVDAKFPLAAYRELRAASTQAEAKAARLRFGQHLRGHVRDIAERYIVPGTTADSALLFVPSESVYSEAFEHHADVVEFAARRRVWIVSPTTLWATLTTPVLF